MDTRDIAPLFDSWILHLEAERKTPQTLKTYGDGVRAFLRWADTEGREPTLDKPTVNAFVTALLNSGAAPATARVRQLALRRFSAWLAAEREIEVDALETLKPPKLDEVVIPELDEDELRRLVKACSGDDLRGRRDEALVRFMVETGVRAGEVVAMTVQDVNLREGTAVVQRGKGGKGRQVPFGPQTGRALDRYIRIRRHHHLSESPALWLGDRQHGLSYQGLYSALKARAQEAGIDNFSPHVLRHTAAGRWLAAGGSEGGLMAVAGWTRRDMIDRYTRATSQRRAADEARRLSLGDW